MCGISGGISNPLILQEKNIIAELTHLGCLRGWNGAGSFVLYKKGTQYSTRKTLSTGTTLVLSKEYNNMLVDSPQVVVNHCRAPTTGDINLPHTHPFHVGGVIGVHNGTLRRLGGNPIPKDASDSELMFKSIAELGIEKTISEISGAYVIVWFDKNEHTLNFLRNDERTLFFGSTVGIEFPMTEYFSSQENFLQFVCGNRNMKVYTRPLPAHRWIQYDFKDKITKYVDKGEVKPPPPKTYSYADIGEKWKRHSPWDWTLDGKDKTNKKSKKEKKGHNEGHEGYVKSYGNLYVSPEICQGILKKGCDYCREDGTTLEDARAGKLTWLSRAEFLCAECADQVWVKELYADQNPNLFRDLQ